MREQVENNSTSTMHLGSHTKRVYLRKELYISCEFRASFQGQRTCAENAVTFSTFKFEAKDLLGPILYAQV